MSRLRWASLGEVMQFEREPVEVDPSNRYQQIGVRGFGRGLISYPEGPASALSKLRYYKLAPNRLVVSNIKAWEGAVTFTDPDEKGRIASNRFLQYKPADDVHLSYILHNLLSDSGVSAMGNASPGSADRNRTLSKAGFEAIRIPLPDLPEQRRIATHLDHVAEVASHDSDTTSKAWSVIERMLDGVSTSTTLSSYLAADFDEVTLEPSARYQQIGVYGQGRGVIDRGSFAGADTKYKSMYRVRPNQVVMSRLKAFEGAVAVVPGEHDGAVVSKEFPTFTPSEGTDPRFLRAMLRGERITAQLKAASIGVGARRERVSAERFLTVEVPDVSTSVQARIGSMVALVERIERLAVRATDLRTSLLPATRNAIFLSLG